MTPLEEREYAYMLGERHYTKRKLLQAAHANISLHLEKILSGDELFRVSYSDVGDQPPMLRAVRIQFWEEVGKRAEAMDDTG